VDRHDKKGWLVWQLHDNNKIVLEIFMPSDLRYCSWGGEILMAILDVFFNLFFIFATQGVCVDAPFIWASSVVK
jgi:hypothetical protein